MHHVLVCCLMLPSMEGNQETTLGRTSGVGDAMGELVSCLLEVMLDLLL